MSSDVEAMAAGLLAEANEACRDELGRAAREVYVSAVREWPIDTGLSRQLLTLREEKSPSNAGRWRLTDDVWYAGYIRTRRLPTGAVHWLLLVPLAIEIPKAAAAIARRIEGR